MATRSINTAHCDFPGVALGWRWCHRSRDGHNYEKGPGSDPGIRERLFRYQLCDLYGDPNLVPGSGTVCLPTVVSQAKYLINICLPRYHELAGVTLCAKNFFGSVWHPNPPPGNAYYYHGWCPFFMHKTVASLISLLTFPCAQWDPTTPWLILWDIKDLGGKTFLFIGESIRPKYWSAPPFNGRPASSLFIESRYSRLWVGHAGLFTVCGSRARRYAW